MSSVEYHPQDGNTVGAISTGTVDLSTTFDHIRFRRCSCGTDMNIRVGLDSNGKLIDIRCVSGCFLRTYTVGQQRPTLFRLNGWDKDASTFIYCKECKSRRAWRLFKEL